MDTIFVEPLPARRIQGVEEQGKDPIPDHRGYACKEVVWDAWNEVASLCVVKGDANGQVTARIAIVNCRANCLVHGGGGFCQTRTLKVPGTIHWICLNVEIFIFVCFVMPEPVSVRTYCTVEKITSSLLIPDSRRGGSPAIALGVICHVICQWLCKMRLFVLTFRCFWA